MSAGINIREMLDLCPFQSIVGTVDADLKQRPPSAILAVPRPGELKHDPDGIEAARNLLDTGATVLVLAAAHADRERVLDLLGIAMTDRIRQGGRA